MTELDDFLIEEDSGMSPAVEDEEDLLADVGGSALDRLNSWELDSQISQPPAAMPQQARMVPEPARAGTTEPVPAATAQAAAVAMLGPGKGAAVLVVDPRAAQGDSPVESALMRLGYKPRVCQNGSSTRDELQSGRYRTVFLRLDVDFLWAKLLVSTAVQRWPQLRFIASLPAAVMPQAHELKESGVADVVPEPLPDDARLLLVLQRTAQGNTPPPTSMPASRLNTPLIPQPAVRPAPVMEAAAGTSSDVTRLKAELVAAQRRSQDLEVQLSQARGDKARAGAGDELAAELKTLLTRFPYGQAMDQALRHMMTAVEKNTPLTNEELGRHLKNLRSVRAALRKVEERLGITSTDFKAR